MKPVVFDVFYLHVESLSNGVQTKMPRSGNVRPQRRAAPILSIDSSDPGKILHPPKKAGITLRWV